jgi:glycosyltransferase involved in cell wall biosynthesis
LRSELEAIGFNQIPEFPLNTFYDRNAATQLRAFVRLLQQLKIDVVHTHDFYTNIFGMAAATLARIPARIASRRESGKRASHKRRVERLAYRMAGAVVANCEVVRQQLINEGVDPHKVVTIHNGLEARCFSDSAPDKLSVLKRLGLPTDRQLRFVTSVANLRPVKDYPTFLRAAAKVIRIVPNSAFLIAGEGRLLDSLQEFAGELGIRNNVFFLGRRESVTDLLGLSEVCVLSSESEGFSNSILEYMAAARPVVATDVGGAREAVEHGNTGYLVSAGNYDEMATCIISLLNDPEQATAMGRRARLMARQNFSAQSRLEKTEQLYEKLLGGSTEPELRP